jgi:hypothetical protein
MQGLADAAAYIQDAKEQATRYAMAQLGRVKAMVRSAILFGLLGIFAAAVAVTVIIVASVFLCMGVAGAIGEVLGGRVWAGELITGAVVIGVIGLSGYLVVRRLIGAARLQTIASFEKSSSQKTARHPGGQGSSRL